MSSSEESTLWGLGKGDARRARRRAGHRSRKRREMELYYGGKGRRPRAWLMQNSMRFMACLMFVSLLMYELVALRTSGEERDGAMKENAEQKRETISGGEANVHFKRISLDNRVKEQNDTLQQPHAEQGRPSGYGSTVQSSRPRSSESQAMNRDQAKLDVQRAELNDTSERTHSSFTSRYDKSEYRKQSAEGENLPYKNGKEGNSHSSNTIQADEAASGSSGRGWRRREKRSSLDELSGSTVSREGTNSEERTSRKELKLKMLSHGNQKGTSRGSDDNFWNWFQHSKETEGGGANKVACPEAHDRLCKMFYKILRKHKIRNVFDASCANNDSWMRAVLGKISDEIWGFKYHCSDPTDKHIDRVKDSLKEFSFVEYHTDQWWKKGFPDGLDLVFAWDILPHIAYGRVWSFFVHARKQNIKYLLFDNYPGIVNDPSPERHYLNVRKHPFKFASAKEVIQNVTEPGETAKRQLLFYESSMLPEQLGS